MEPDRYLAHLRQELELFEDCLLGDLSAPVIHCGTWTLRDLADHLGRGNLWAAAAITEQHGDAEGDPPPADEGGLVRWFRGTGQTLLSELAADPAAPAWTFFPPHTVGFWRRRRALETLIHRFDAEHALGVGSPIDPELAADGVAEVIDIMVPRQVVRGRAEPRTEAVRLEARDTRASWALGPGDPLAVIAADAADLLLLLWNRRSMDDAAIGLSGDRDAASRVLAGPLVP